MKVSEKLSKIIRDHLDANFGVELCDISSATALPLALLEDMAQGTCVSPSLESILDLLDFVDDKESCFQLLSELWPKQAKRFEILKKEEFRFSNCQLSQLLRDKENWMIVTLASRRSGGTTLEEVEDLLPVSGAHKVANLLDKGILQVVNNRLQSPDIVIQSVGSLLNQIANMTLLFKQAHLGSQRPSATTLLAFSEGLNDEGIEAAYKAIANLNEDLESIRKDENMLGERSFYLGLVSDELKGEYE